MILYYSITFVISLLLIPACLLIDKKHNIWLLLLAVFIFISNAGYFALSLSKSLLTALLSNSLAYLGNVFLPFFILMMVVQLSNIKFSKWTPRILIALNCVMLFISTSGGYLPVYYKEVTFDKVRGLVKVYGPLHCLYKFFIIGYFAAIVVIIGYAAIKKSAVSTKHTAFLAAALLGNIALWIVENIAEVQIELLPISYIMTEGMILLLYGILLDFETARFAHAHEEPDDIEEYPADAAIVADIVSDPVENDFSTEQIRTVFANWNEIKELTQREKEVLIFILEKRKRKDIAQVLFVTESTIKKHTSNIYKKLGVTSRAELFEKVISYIENC